MQKQENVTIPALRRQLAETEKSFENIHTWSQIFDESDLDTKKMIANYVIKRIRVFAGYKLDIELNMHAQQFLNGLENTENERAAS